MCVRERERQRERVSERERERESERETEREREIVCGRGGDAVYIWLVPKGN